MPSVQGNLYLRCAFVKQYCGMKQNQTPAFSSLYLLILLLAQTGKTVLSKLAAICKLLCLSRIWENTQQFWLQGSVAYFWEYCFFLKCSLSKWIKQNIFDGANNLWIHWWLELICCNWRVWIKCMWGLLSEQINAYFGRSSMSKIFLIWSYCAVVFLVKCLHA